MGGCPTGTAPGSFPRGGRKRGLQTDLQNEIVQEIEDLLARQSIADLDLEALEMAARCQALRLAARALEQRLNTHTSDYVRPELARHSDLAYRTSHLDSITMQSTNGAT